MNAHSKRNYHAPAPVKPLWKDESFLIALAAFVAMTIVALFAPGCISITNHVHMGDGVEASESEATMGRTVGANEVSGTVMGGVAINSAIYSHKVISPDTTATLAK